MLTINELYDLSHSLAGDYLKQFTYPWEALAGISDLILEIGKQLPEDEYVHPTDWDGNVLEDVWVAKDATVFKTAYLHGPCIIGHRTEVRQRLVPPRNVKSRWTASSPLWKRAAISSR